jgi:acetolactate synthase-1/2/3 large subunit
MYQERTYPARVSGTALTNPDFAKFIEAFGGHGEIVEATDQLVPAVKRAMASGKPAIVEIRTNPEQVTNRATIADLRAQATKAAEGAAAAVPAQASRTPAPRRTGPRIR